MTPGGFSILALSLLTWNTNSIQEPWPPAGTISSSVTMFFLYSLHAELAPPSSGVFLFQRAIIVSFQFLLSYIKTRAILEYLKQSKPSLGRQGVVTTKMELGDISKKHPRYFLGYWHLPNNNCQTRTSPYKIWASWASQRVQLLYLLPLKLPQNKGMNSFKKDKRWYSQPIPCNHLSREASHCR